MTVTVAIPTFRRSWAIKHSLSSLAKQSRSPDEVIVSLMPSNDGSEEIVKQFDEKLPIRLIVSKASNAIENYQCAIDNARSDILLFMDDDAIAHERLVERYVTLFRRLDGVGGIGGLVYSAYLDNEHVTLSGEPFYPREETRTAPHRRPMELYDSYSGWISTSGFLGIKCEDDPVTLSGLIHGGNMAFLRDMIADLRLEELYQDKTLGTRFEQLLAYQVRRKGFHTYGIGDPEIAPIVWHMKHGQSLTRGSSFEKRFLMQVDDCAMYWKLKAMNADVSFARYLFGVAATSRKDPARMLGSLAGIAIGFQIYARYKTRHRDSFDATH
jgi:glycosyltransferase involved in cell wall biosynthesis